MTTETLERTPHYHPCGHCKQRPNYWPCFTDEDADLLKHEGIYHLCDVCQESTELDDDC
jgi:hypothetical protein